jgi:hypothetical protein
LLCLFQFNSKTFLYFIAAVAIDNAATATRRAVGDFDAVDAAAAAITIDADV